MDGVRSERRGLLCQHHQPAVIAVIDARKPDSSPDMFAVPAAGPHGLDFDPATGRLFCACDAGMLVTLDARSGKSERAAAERRARCRLVQCQAPQLYVAVGDPGVIDVFDTTSMQASARSSPKKARTPRPFRHPATPLRLPAGQPPRGGVQGAMSDGSQTSVLSRSDVARLMDFPAYVEAVEAGFRAAPAAGPGAGRRRDFRFRTAPSMPRARRCSAAPATSSRSSSTPTSPAIRRATGCRPSRASSTSPMPAAGGRWR